MTLRTIYNSDRATHLWPKALKNPYLGGSASSLWGRLQALCASSVVLLVATTEFNGALRRNCSMCLGTESTEHDIAATNVATEMDIGYVRICLHERATTTSPKRVSFWMRKPRFGGAQVAISREGFHDGVHVRLVGGYAPCMYIYIYTI